MHLGLASLLLVLGVGVHAQDLASNFTSASATECKLPFMYNKVHYYGCTTAGNPKGDARPWCILKESAARGKQDWRFCDQTSVAKVTSLSAGDNTKCVGPGWRPNGGTPDELVFGCRKPENEKEFSCVVGGNKVTCTNLTPTYAPQNGLMAVVAGLSGNGSGGGKNVATIIGASIGGGLLVALVAGLVIVRRRGSSSKGGAQNGAGGGGPGGQWDYKHAGMDNQADYGGGMTGGGNPGLLDATPQGKVYAVVSTYTPTLGDELEIQPGDKVGVLVEYDDGWCQGINHTRGGLKGVFPKHCIDLTS